MTSDSSKKSEATNTHEKLNSGNNSFKSEKLSVSDKEEGDESSESGSSDHDTFFEK